ncbi:MAG: hypothetical protein JWO35_440 [Candidatus Saccharibacteria bacterium]|nr:hypothetical protein [Candidatus Saccharibacteria bacterium]
MTLALIGLGIVTLFELLLWLPAFWHWRKPLAIVVLAALAITTVGIVLAAVSGWATLVMIISVYRAVNLLRLIDGRTQNDYLFHGARRTSFWLIGWQAAALGLAAVNHAVHANILTWWYLLAALQLIGAAVILWATTRQLRTTRPPVLEQDISNNDLPSLTVAIPARNETSDLEACLRSLLKCHYHKLEILVLDDCSQNKRTPEIIRGFAHDGVRFIAGDVPPEHWLAKNYAYDQLSKAANGELLLFCGVDARFGPDSLQVIVKTMLQKKKSMLCVVPRSFMAKEHGVVSSVVQSCRYAWELALPRRLFQRPPVLSSCWVITRQALRSAGGFASYKQSILPERHLAHRSAEASQGYTFLCSDAAMGVSSRKSLDEQLATGIRTRYPQLHRRPELVLLVSLAEFALLVWPFLILIISILTGVWVLAVFSAVVCTLLTIFYAKIMNLTYRKSLLRGLVLLPFAALYDIALLNYSMWQYEFHEVIWKGRNICLPVMRVYPSLPKI